MNCNDQGGTTLPPWQLATVRGEPYDVAGYKLTPVARLLTYTMGQGTLRANSVSGWGAGMVRVRPLAIIAEQDGRRQRIRLIGATNAALRTMLAVGVAITLLSWAVRLLARRDRRLKRIDD